MSAATPVNKAMSSHEWALLVALSVLWGGSFFFIGVAVKELPTLTIVVGRVVLASLILLVVLRASGTALPTSGTVWLAFFGMGFLNNVVPFTLIVWGQGHIASGVASILNATTPLFTVIVAHLLTSDEKMTGNRLFGVIVGLAGVTIMIGADVMQSPGVGMFAQLACLAAAVSYAFAGVFGRRFRALGVSPLVTATGQVMASSIMLFPVMLLVDKPWLLSGPSLQAVGAMVGLAALSTALAYVVFFRILSTAGATNLALVTFLIPVSAILLGILLLGEVLQTRHLMGMSMIGIGLAAIDGRLWKRLSPVG